MREIFPFPRSRGLARVPSCPVFRVGPASPRSLHFQLINRLASLLSSALLFLPSLSHPSKAFVAVGCRLNLFLASNRTLSTGWPQPLRIWSVIKGTKQYKTARYTKLANKSKYPINRKVEYQKPEDKQNPVGSLSYWRSREQLLIRRRGTYFLPRDQAADKI